MDWSTQQVVRDARRRRVWVVENKGQRPPLSFDEPDHGTYVPRWGSDALLKLAVQAHMVGLEPSEVILRDRAQAPLPREYAEERSEEIVEALSQGDLEAAHALLHGERGPLQVMAIYLISDDGTQLHVGRFGGLETTHNPAPQAFLDAARSILSIS